MDIEDKFTRIDNKLDKMQDNLHSIDKTLVAQHENLKLHIKRTDLLENHVQTLEKQIKPISDHVLKVNFIFTLIGGISIGVGIIVGVTQIVEFFSKLP